MNEELIALYENINRYYPGTIEATPAEFANSFNNDANGFRAFLDIAQREYPKAFDHYIPTSQVLAKNSNPLILGVEQPQTSGPVKPVRRTKDDIFESTYPIPVDQIDAVREQFAASETEVRARNIPINVKLNTVLRGGDMFPSVFSGGIQEEVQKVEAMDPKSFLSRSDRVDIDKQAGIEALSYFPLSNYTPSQISKAFNRSKSESDLANISLIDKSEEALGEERAPQRFTTFSSSTPGKAITYRGERFKITQPEKLAVSHDDAAVNIEHLLATSPLTTQDILEAESIEGYGNEQLLRMKDFLAFDDKLRAEKEIYDLSLYQRIAEKKLSRIEEPVKQAYDRLAGLFQASQQGAQMTPEMEDEGKQLAGFLQGKTDQVQEYEDALDALDSSQSQLETLGQKYPDLKLADELNRKIQEKKDVADSAELSFGMKFARMLFTGPLDPLVEPIGRPVLEAIPKLFGRLASTKEGETAGNGSEEAAVQILRRSRARIPSGTFRDASVAQRPMTERVSDFEYDGKVYTLGFDKDNVPTQIYDETGNIAPFDPSFKENLMVEAVKNPAVRSGIKERFNSSSLVNTLQDVSADLLGTFTLAYMTQGLGTATSIQRAREFASVMLQYEGSFIEEGLREGLSLDQAVVYGRFKSIQEGGWEAAFPFISRVTDGKVLTETKDAVKRIIAEGNAKALRSLAYKETRKNVLGMVQEGGEEFGVNITDPFINQAFNNFYETDLDTEFSSFKDMATDFAIGSAVSVIPGAIGSVNARRKILGSQSLQESVFHAVTNLADVKRVSGDFKLEDLKNVIPALEATKNMVDPILKHGDYSDAKKIRITSAIFDAQVAAMDRIQLAGTEKEQAAERAVEEADKVVEQVIKEKDTPKGIKTPETEQIIPEGVQNPLQDVESKKKGFAGAGLKSKETQDASHLGNWLLDNGSVGDVISNDNVSYEITEKSDKRREITLTPFELNEDGTKDYNHSGVILLTDSSNGIKKASGVFEQAYTNTAGERIVAQSTFEPVKSVENLLGQQVGQKVPSAGTTGTENTPVINPITNIFDTWDDSGQADDALFEQVKDLPEAKEAVEAYDPTSDESRDRFVEQIRNLAHKPLILQKIQINEGDKVERLSPEAERIRVERGGENAGAALVTGAVHRAAEEARRTGQAVSSEQLIQAEQDAIKAWAQEKNLWVEDIHDENLGGYFADGTEAKVYHKDGKHILKANDGKSYVNWQDFLDSITIGNKLFPSTPLKVVGFGMVTNSDGEKVFGALMEQPYIKNARYAMQEEIAKSLKRRGFEQTEDQFGWRHKQSGVVIKDVSNKNVLIDQKGNFHYIDVNVVPNYANEPTNAENIAQTTENVSSIPESGEPVDAINRQQTETTATNTEPNDTQNQERVPSEIQVGQEPVQTQLNQETGQGTIEGGGVLETRQAPLVSKEETLKGVREMAMNSGALLDADTVYNAARDTYDRAGVSVEDIRGEITKVKSPNWADDISRPIDTGEGIPPELSTPQSSKPLAVPEFTDVEREASRMLKEWSVFRSADPDDVKVMQSYERMVSRGQLLDNEEERNKYERAVMKIAATQASMADLLNQIEGMFALDGKTRDQFERFLIQSVSPDSSLDIRAKQAILNSALNGLVSPALKPMIQKLSGELASAVSGTMNLMRDIAQDPWLSAKDSEFIRAGLLNPKGPSGAELTEAEKAIEEADSELAVSDRALEILGSETEAELIGLISAYNTALDEMEAEGTEAPNPDIKAAKEMKTVLETGIKSLYGDNHQEKLKEDIDNAEKRCL